jgi:putative cardiolipin synthase
MGLLIESPALAERLATGFDKEIPNLAYEVRLGGDRRTLKWLEATPAGRTSYAAEPGSGRLRRAMVRMLCLLPIEWLL